jgi:choline dehydrogenase-like flavoprotein
MRVDDLAAIPSNDPIQADILIIGSGPAGLTLARELKDENVRLVLLESGGLQTEPEADALSEIESVGYPRVMDQTKVRNRILGGSSHTWTGRCGLLDPLDLEARSWVPFSGWPIGIEELKTFLFRACSHLGVQPLDQGPEIWPLLKKARPQPEVDEQKLSPFFWQFSQDETNPWEFTRFGPRFLRQGQPNCRVIYHAVVTHIDTDPANGTVLGVEVADQANNRRRMRAPIVVLCAGGIENARLLLASRKVAQAGVGNDHDLVGRYLMDHPRCTIAQYHPGQIREMEKVHARFGHYHLKNTDGIMLLGLALADRLQRQEQLLNCAAWFTEVDSDEDPWARLKAFVRPGEGGRKISDLFSALRRPGFLISGVSRRLFLGRSIQPLIGGLNLEAFTEQMPDANSRLTLSDRTDRFGLPLSRIDWRVGDKERQSIARLGHLIAAEFPKINLAPPTLVPWVRDKDYAAAEFWDPAHPSGTTRMADSPGDGVVDRNLEVHGAKGLYVAGGSVFPNNGHVNPTLTIVVLAVRLAETLRRQLRNSVATTSISGPDDPV